MHRHFYHVIAFLIAIDFTQTCIISPALADPVGSASKYGLNYMTGGVGHDEVLAMRPHAKEFSMNLLFSEGAAGQAVTDVNVNIYNEQDVLVFRIKGAKPMLYVNLPAGKYMILASNNGAKLRYKVNITENTNQKVILNWKDEALDSRETAE
jgi:hypothetical protein